MDVAYVAALLVVVGTPHAAALALESPDGDVNGKFRELLALVGARKAAEGGAAVAVDEALAAAYAVKVKAWMGA